ncbi:hypothetical protein MEQU1_002855 [Malassezia equina]|uniref:Reduced meiotic recombination protein 1 n=1 Tax=Malassezia equina TaxID=1381935 RepID=A0AAF0J159_9BASI|nr:hypothetical protein MEQU1_002855 [Malassezia equina]
MAEVPAPDPADLEVYEMPDAPAMVEEQGGSEAPDAQANEITETQDEAQAGEGNESEAVDRTEKHEGAETRVEEDGPWEEGEEADADAHEAEIDEADKEADVAEEEEDEADAPQAEAVDAEAIEAEAEYTEANEADMAEEEAHNDDAEANEAADEADANDAEADDAEADDADAEEAEADDAEADADAADDSSSLSDELPTVRLTFQGQDFAAFPAVSQDSGPFVYMEGEEGSDELVRVSAPELRLPPTTFWEPLDAFFAALRVKDALGEFLEEGTELCLSFPDLDLDLMEDNVYARDITLHDISQLALGFGHQASLHVVVTEEVRFISRYNELATRVNGAAESVDVSDNKDAEPEAGEDNEGTVQAPQDAYGDDAALHEDLYEMDDDAAESRPYDDADHAAYEDEADAHHARGKRTADEPRTDEASKRAKTGAEAS